MPRDCILCDDCLNVLSDLPEASVDLAYLDPPFNTGRSQRGKSGCYEDVWEDVAAYLEFLRPRVYQIHRVLSPRGSILLHCDWRASHHLRLLLDEIFGPKHFVNHLVWVYGLGGSSPRRFARKHDDILFYARTDEYYFRPPRIPATSVRLRGQMKKCTDVLDIPSINNMAHERVGYPSQKPLALLTLLIEACCSPGGLVLDPFCGSGTTLVAAGYTGRRYLGVDDNPDAASLARDRCDKELDDVCAPASPEAE